MAFRGVLPRLEQSTRRLVRPCLYNRVQPDRSYWSRHLPMWRRRQPLDAFFDRSPFAWPAKMMEKPFRDLDAMMEEMMPRSWAVYNRVNTRSDHVKYNNHIFEVEVDVSHFEPKELKVKVIGENLTISGKHEKVEENGRVSREFTRNFIIPQDVDTESLKSLLTDDGTLIVRGTVTRANDAAERTIEIEHEPQSEAQDVQDDKSASK